MPQRPNILYTVIMGACVAFLLSGCHIAAPPVPEHFRDDAGALTAAENMSETLGAVVNGGGNLGRFSALNSQVDKLGLTPHAHEEMIDWFSLQRNLIIDLPGTSSDVIYLVAHYDKTDANPLVFISLLLNGVLDPLVSPTFLSDGAIDNASGVSVVLQLASDLEKKPHHYSYRILFPGSEESGLRGTRAHISRLTPEEVQQIKYVVNVDSVGVTGAGNCITRGISDPHLAYLAKSVAHNAEIPLEEEDSSDLAVSDYLPFMETDSYADVTFGLKFNYIGGLLPQRSWFTNEVSVPVLNFSTCGLMGGASDILSSFLLPVGQLHGFRDDMEKIDIEILYNQFAIIDGLLQKLEEQVEK